MVRGTLAIGADRHDFYTRETWTAPSSRHPADYPVEEAHHMSPPRRPVEAMDVGTALNEYCQIPAVNYALAVVQEDGQVKTFTSEAIAHAEPQLFTAQFVDRLRRAAQGSTRGIGFPQPIHGSAGRYQDMHLEVPEPVDEESFSVKARKRARWARQSALRDDESVIPVPVQTTKQLIIGDTAEVQKFYTNRFKELQQAACKIIAKAFVKVMEPKKQSNHPYTGGLEKAPFWWPKGAGRDMVRHKEPDHLLKAERITLLVHVIQVVVDQSIEKTPHVNAVNIKRLEEVTQEAMANWFNDKDHPLNSNKKPLLKEIFKVARLEERYRMGEIDESCTIAIAHGDERPGSIGSDEEADEGPKFEEEGLTPTSQSLSTPPDGLVSPHTVQMQRNMQFRPVENEAHDNFNYNIRELPVRSYQLQPHHPQEDTQTYADTTPLQISNQAAYMPRPAAGFQAQAPSLHDSTRRSTWQAESYPSPTPSSLYTNWGANNPIIHETPMQYNNFPSSAPSTVPQTVPFLPPPTLGPTLLPPMHQQHQPYAEHLMNRSFESGPPIGNPLRTGSLGHPHQMPQHNPNYPDYLHTSVYHGSGDLKDDQVHSA